MKEMDEELWESLMGKIREGSVVPIIGTRLLVGADGQSSLQSQIAARLMRDCCKDAGEVSLPPFRELNEAVSQLKLKKIDEKDIDLYERVFLAITAVTGAKDFTIPVPIRQLAEIADFRLFVTLTPDDLLVRSLREHYGVNEIVHVPSQKSDKREDLARGWEKKKGEVNVLYLFGKARREAMFAIHDEDVLEYAHNIIARPEAVPIFRAELRQRNLLLIGCNVPDWLGRFFLRLTNEKRLSETDKRRWVIDPLQPQENLTCFLESYSRNTKILSETSPTQFVCELHRRWMAEHGGVGQEAAQTAHEAAPRRTMFFISYSRKTDLPFAERLYQSLLGLGVADSEVWFDRKTLEPGQDFQRGILDGIHSCRYFLPLLSRATNQRDKAFVFTEWDEATECRKAVNSGDFIFPVIVDADFAPECYTGNKSVWQWQNNLSLDFAHAPEGQPDDRLKKKLKELVRDARIVSKQS